MTDTITFGSPSLAAFLNRLGLPQAARDRVVEIDQKIAEELESDNPNEDDCASLVLEVSDLISGRLRPLVPSPGGFDFDAIDWGSDEAEGAPVVAPPEEPTVPTSPETPAGFTLSITGQASVAAGTVLDLRPLVSGASGSVSYTYFGTLPLGATFNGSTGGIAGRALIAGSYQVWVSATDSAGATVTAGIVIVVT